MTGSSTRALLGLRLLQLVRPFLIIVVLRLLDLGMATRYVALLGVYVIALEAYNVIAPSDRLYLAESGPADLRLVMYRRARAALLVVPLSAVAMVHWVGLSWVQAGGLALLSCLNGFATAQVAYFHARVPAGRLGHAELLSWVVQLGALALLAAAGQLLAGFTLYALEQTLRALWLRCTAAPIRPDDADATAASGRGAHPAPVTVAAMAIEGMTLTLANHIHRIPFVVAAGRIDPLFVVAAQVSAAVYNMLIGVAARVTVPPRYGVYLGLGLLLAAAVLLAGSLDAGSMRLTLQTVLLCMLAVLHGAVMTRIPGRQGMAATRQGKIVLIGGLIVVVLVGALVSPLAFLASPAVLAVAGLVHGRPREGH